MSLRLRAAVGLARAAGLASRAMRRGGGTTIPGVVGRALDPSLTRHLACRLANGAILVSGTNGKTTTSRLIAAMLTAAGHRVVHNRAGANLISGVSTALLAGRGDVGLFEVDEAALPQAVAELTPRLVLCLNLFRDQLDRYGELDHVAGLWQGALRRLPASSCVLLNADDPRVANLGSDLGCRVRYFGLDAPDQALPELQHAADSIYCPRCGSLLAFDLVYYGHIGHYRCSGCGWARPQPELTARDLSLSAGELSRLTITGAGGSASERFETSLPGLYNMYNVLGAVSAATELGLPPAAVRDAAGRFSGAFGRTEIVRVGDRQLRLMLAKNPVGFNEVVRTVLLDQRPLDLYLALNDRIADGQDVSWIWDVDFECLAGKCHSVAIGGTRAEELAMRLKYAGFAPELLRVYRDHAEGIRAALESAPPGGTVYAIPTYTAMLDLRAALAGLGLVKHFWQD